MSKTGNPPPVARLHYKRDDLILKEGDFGIAVYKILEGEVRLTREKDGKDDPIGSKWKGDIIGEMNFISRGYLPYTRTARASQATELEVWHIAPLLEEYKDTPPFIRFMLDQILQRLRRTHATAEKLREKRLTEEEEKVKWAAQKRRYYRKDINKYCSYWPVTGSKDGKLRGLVKDVSRGGLGLEITENNKTICRHEPGDEFLCDLILPDGKDIHFKAGIVHAKRGEEPGTLFLGMTINEIGYESQKRLGFFLMP
jgi:CRP-like cAMP-binding protein